MWPPGQRGGGGGGSAGRIFATVATFGDSNKYKIEHDHVLKSWILIFWLWPIDPIPRVGGGLPAKCVRP